MRGARAPDLALLKLCPSIATLQLEFGNAGACAAAEALRLCSLWRDPELLSVVDFNVSGRLRASLGTAAATLTRGGLYRFCVTISRLDLHRTRQRLLETVCHELAHVAAWREALTTNRRIRPHGTEWQKLVEMAGYPVHTSTNCRVSNAPSASMTAIPRHLATSDFFLHVCPVCQTSRLARKRVPQWRCASCVEAGLCGVLTVDRCRRNK